MPTATLPIDEHRKMECAIAKEGIGFRNVPARGDLFTDGIGQFDEMFLIVSARTQLHVMGRIRRRLRRARECKKLDQFIAARRNLADVIARVLHGLQHGDGAGRRVVAHAVGDAAVLVGIVGEDDRHLAVDRFRGGAAQSSSPRGRPQNPRGRPRACRSRSRHWVASW